MMESISDGIYFSKSQINNIKFLNDISTLFSVRDLGTRTFLEKIGCSKAIHLTPCPSMFLYQHEKTELPNKCDTIIVGVNIRNNASDAVKSKIVEVARKLNKCGFGLVSMSHSTRNVEGRDLEKKLGVRIIISDNPNQLMENYRKLDFSIGMRGHSNIFSFSSIKPFISLSYNIKSNFFAEMVGMKDYLFPVNGEWSIDRFTDIFLQLTEHSSTIKNKFTKLKDDFYLMNKNFAKRVIQEII